MSRPLTISVAVGGAGRDPLEGPDGLSLAKDVFDFDPL